jgi:hypothetical protein
VRARLALAVALACMAKTGQAQSDVVLAMSTARFSDPLSLKALMGSALDQAVPRGPRNLAYVRDEIRLGYRLPAGVLSVIVRQSATLVADEGAVAVVRDVATPGGPGYSYDQPVRLRMSGFVGTGLAFDAEGRGGDTPWRWWGGVQLLRLNRILERDLHGEVAYDMATGIYGLQAQSSYASDRLTFPFQRGFPSSGVGLLFQGGVGRWVSDAGYLALKVEDVGRLNWSGLPREDMSLSTRTSQVDADGYLVYRPLANGRNRQDRYSVAAVSTWTLEGEWLAGEHWSALAKVRRIDGFDRLLPSTGVGWRQGDWRLSVGRMWYERALSLGVSRGAWRLAIAADRLGAGAHARVAALQWQAALD